MDPKELQATVTNELAAEDAVDEKFGTVRDVQDMDRMGKLQQLRVTSTFSRFESERPPSQCRCGSSRFWVNGQL
jgi:hypothetical protein